MSYDILFFILLKATKKNIQFPIFVNIKKSKWEKS